jgi:hypothetical protein
LCSNHSTTKVVCDNCFVVGRLTWSYHIDLHTGAGTLGRQPDFEGNCSHLLGTGCTHGHLGRDVSYNTMYPIIVNIQILKLIYKSVISYPFAKSSRTHQAIPRALFRIPTR